MPVGAPVRTFTASTVNFSMDGTVPPPGKCRVDDLARQQALSERRVTEMARMQWELLNRDKSGQQDAYREPPPPPAEPPKPGAGDNR